MTDLADLKRKAEAATPGPWRALLPPDVIGKPWVELANGCGYAIAIAEEANPNDAGDMAFIAAANPAVVLELLARLEAAEKVVGHVIIFGASPPGHIGNLSNMLGYAHMYRDKYELPALPRAPEWRLL